MSGILVAFTVLSGPFKTADFLVWVQLHTTLKIIMNL